MALVALVSIVVLFLGYPVRVALAVSLETVSMQIAKMLGPLAAGAWPPSRCRTMAAPRADASRTKPGHLPRRALAQRMQIAAGRTVYTLSPYHV